MSEHRATLIWSRDESGFGYKEYSRDHDWVFPNGHIVRASAAPKYLGNDDCVDPEEAYVASLSSCHMLTFLALASMQGFVLDSYEDEAVGVLAPNDDRKMIIKTVTLHPKTVFSGDKQPSHEELEALHHKAHEECFIANSVLTEIITRLD
jgi:organic hydroperoxide reductase OsmC/OhrA